MKILFQLSVALLLCSSITAQSVITRISAGQDFYYYNNELQTVMNDASPGDTVLYPGAQFEGNFNINNSVVLIGVGHDPTSSTATGISLVTGTVNVNAPNTEIIGIKFGGSVTFNSAAVGSTLQRCKVEGNLTFGSSASNIVVTECIFANPSTSVSANSQINLGSADNIEINNSMIEIINANTGSSGCVFNNNIFFDGFTGVNGAVFNCNLFRGNFSSVGSLGVTENDNIFNHNVVFSQTCTDTCLTTLLGLDNVSNDNLFLLGSSVMAGGTGLPDYAVVGEDYFVNEISPAFTHCPTNQQTGVYGGPQPFKLGAIPINPHISSKTISGVSTTDQINVTVGVEAQDN